MWKSFHSYLVNGNEGDQDLAMAHWKPTLRTEMVGNITVTGLSVALFNFSSFFPSDIEGKNYEKFFLFFLFFGFFFCCLFLPYLNSLSEVFHTTSS